MLFEFLINQNCGKYHSGKMCQLCSFPVGNCGLNILQSCAPCSDESVNGRGQSENRVTFLFIMNSTLQGKFRDIV